LLVEYHWPGNVRELENVIERAVVYSQSGVITESLINFSGADNRRFYDIGQRLREGAGLTEILSDVERQALTEAINISAGDRVSAAAMLGLKFEDLQSRSRELGL
jgi:DNA-binding NtrC family response regulator